MEFKKKIKDNPAFQKIALFLRNSPLFSYWRTMLFVVLTIVLIIILVINLDLKLFFKSLKQLNVWALLLLLLLSIIEHVLCWIRYKLLMRTGKCSMIFDYVSVTTVANTIPPKPLGMYYRFLLSMHFFRTKLKNTAFLVVIDSFYEAFFTLLFAIAALFVFPRADVGLEIVLVLIGIVGIVYFGFSFYETRTYLIKSSVLRKAVDYFSNMKAKIKDSLIEFLKLNKSAIILGFFLSLVKYFIGALKVYLLFLFFGLDVNFWIAFGIWGIANFVGSSSSLPGGIGAFEFSFVYLAETANINKEVALTVAILERIFNIWIWVAFTGVYLVSTKTKVWTLHTYFIQSLSKMIKSIRIVTKHNRRLKHMYKTIKKPAKRFVKKLSKRMKKNI